MAVAISVPYYIMELQGDIVLLITTAFALSTVASSVALCMGCATKDVKVALQLSPLIFVPQILFAGFFIKMAQIPRWLRWAQYLCSLKFAINLALIIEFGGDTGCACLLALLRGRPPVRRVLRVGPHSAAQHSTAYDVACPRCRPATPAWEGHCAASREPRRGPPAAPEPRARL